MPYNPFDLTKVWYKKDFPLIEVGELELNRNPENYFAEVEQAAFSPANIVPGIGFSPDQMLQGRLFSYGDTQRYRLGVNYWQIPVNYPKNAENFNPYHRDGAMRVLHPNVGGANQVTYSPNSYGEQQDSKEHQEPALDLFGNASHWNFREDDDNYFEQPGKLFRLMSPEEQQRLFAKYRPRDARYDERSAAAPYQPLLPSRSGLRRRRGKGARHSDERSGSRTIAKG